MLLIVIHYPDNPDEIIECCHRWGRNEEGTEKRRIKLKPSIPHFIPEDQLIVKKNVVNERTTGDLGFVNASNLWKFNLRGDPPCWQRWPGELPGCVSLVLQPWSRLVWRILQIATLIIMQRTTCCLSTELAWRKVRTRPTQTIMPTIAFVMIRLTKSLICQTAVAKESGIEHRKTHPCHVQKQTSQGWSGGKVCT